MEEFLASIGVDTNDGYWSKNQEVFIVDVDEENWGKLQTVLDRDSNMEYVPEVSDLNLLGSHQVYQNEDFQITLISDFEKEEFKIAIEERK